MRILKANIIRTARSKGFILQSIDAVKTYYARPVFSKWNPADLLHKEAIILQLGHQYFLMGYAISSVRKGYSEYKAGKNFVLRHYTNGNLAIYPITKGTLGLSILNFTITTRKLQFDSSTLCIPTQNLPASYLIEVDNNYTTITCLNSTGNFTDFCSVPRETLRRWKEKKSFLPVKTTKSGYAYYSLNQVPIAKALASERSSSAIIYKTIMDTIEKIEPGEARCYHFFRSSITDYHKSQYKSLQAALHRLVSEGYLKRIKRGYYSTPKK